MNPWLMTLVMLVAWGVFALQHHRQAWCTHQNGT